MASTAEYALTVGTRLDEMTGIRSTIFGFATVREFRSFQYRIDVADELDATARTITLRIGGVRSPSSLVPSSGSATTEITYPGLSGDYTVLITGSRQSQSFRLHVDGRKVTIDPIDTGGFVEVRSP